MKSILRRRWPHAAAAAVTLAVGFVLGEQFGEAEPAEPSFHHIRVNRPEEYRALVDPETPGVRDLAERLGTMEAAYFFVRDRIAFDPAAAAGAPAETLALGRASCLGKATLLTSLYRALGVPAADVRVVTGQIAIGGRLVEHAWVDLEYGSICLQQDPTDLLGVHDFLRFPNRQFEEAFVRRGLFCFNDRSFAAVSQLNGRGGHP